MVTCSAGLTMNSNEGVNHTHRFAASETGQLTLKGPWNILPQIRSVEADATNYSARDSEPTAPAFFW